MSFTRDRDRRARGIGSIAARDLVSGRGRLLAVKKAHDMARRDRILANEAINGFLGFGAISLGERGPSRRPKTGNLPPVTGGGGGGRPGRPGRTMTIPQMFAQATSGPRPLTPISDPRVPHDPWVDPGPREPLTPTGPGSGVDTVLTEPNGSATGYPSGGGGGGGGSGGGASGTSAIVDPLPEDLPEVVDPGSASPSEMFGLTQKNLLILAALGIGGYLLWKKR